jgi:hypothetical protein
VRREGDKHASSTQRAHGLMHSLLGSGWGRPIIAPASVHLAAAAAARGGGVRAWPPSVTSSSCLVFSLGSFTHQRSLPHEAVVGNTKQFVRGHGRSVDRSRAWALILADALSWITVIGVGQLVMRLVSGAYPMRTYSRDRGSRDPALEQLDELIVVARLARLTSSELFNNGQGRSQ